MLPQVTALMSVQHGLVTRRQAHDAGLDLRRVDRWVRTGVWTAVVTGVYAETAFVATLTSTRDRRLLVDRATSLRIRHDHVMSHDSSAYELDLAILHARRPLTHVTRPDLVGTHFRFGIKHHLAPYPESQVVVVNGRRVLGPARTAVDIAREHGSLPGVVAMDSALRMGSTKSDLEAVAAAMTSWPQITVVRECIELADPDTDSLIETLARDLVSELGFGRPQTQFGLTDGRQTAWADLRIGRHLVEADGKIKYRPPSRGGVAEKSPEEVLDDEKERQDFLCGFKLGMSRVTFAEHFGQARAYALERIRREYLDTCQRFGTSIDDLAPYVVTRRRPRPGSRSAA